MHHSVQHGYTLLEMMVALTLFGVISIVLVVGLRMAVGSMDAGESHAQSVRHIMAVQRFLRDKIQVAKPVRDKDDSGKFSFQGGADSITFVSEVPRSIVQGALAQYRLKLTGTADESQLEIALEEYPKDERLRSPTFDETVHISNIQSVAFAYFGAIDAQEEKVWHTQWMNQNKLPALVKIQLTLNSGIHWPALVIAPGAAL